jgi:phage terminase large subunit-like protein
MKKITVYGLTAPLVEISRTESNWLEGEKVCEIQGFKGFFAYEDLPICRWGLFGRKTLEDAGGNIYEETTAEEDKKIDPNDWNINVEICYHDLLCFVEVKS